MNIVYLQLGSNIENRKLYLQQAMHQINDHIGKIISKSKIYESSPWGIKNQNNFLNQVILINSNFDAQEILKLSKDIESNLGRKKTRKWGARRIDIDILFYNNDIITTNQLSIPHPLIQERLFVLTPLSDIAADYIHPKYKKNISSLLCECTDKEKVQEYEI